MAVRRATRQYDDIISFLTDYDATLKSGAVFLPPGSTKGDIAPEIHLDFVLPVAGRVGPASAQVVHRSPDGGTALRIVELPAQVQEGFDKVFAEVERLQQYLVQRGSVIPRAEAEAQLAALRQERDEAVAAARQEAAAAAQAQARAQALASSAGSGAAAAVAAATEAAGPRKHGIPVPDVSVLEPALTGSMSDRSFRDLVLQLAVDKVRGLLVVRYPDERVRYGYWDRGGPVAWRCDPVQEGEVLGVLLYRSSQITREQLAESLRFMEERDCRQGEAFIEMGLMSFPQLVMVLGKQVEFVFQQVMQERAGEWAFYTLDALPESFLPTPLRVPSLLYRGLASHARQLRNADLMRAHATRLDSYISLNDDGKSILSEIKFSDGERRLLEVLQSNSWRLREFFSVSPVSRAQTAAVLWALEEMNFLDYASNEARARLMARVGNRIRTKKRHIYRGSLFDVLEIHWICLPSEIEEAYKKLREEFLFSDDLQLPADLKQDASDILKRMDEAYEGLRDDRRRREYRKKVIEPVMIAQSAELLGRKGEMAIMRKDRREACSCFAKALELVPGEAELREGLRRATALV